MALKRPRGCCKTALKNKKSRQLKMVPRLLVCGKKKIVKNALVQKDYRTCERNLQLLIDEIVLQKR